MFMKLLILNLQSVVLSSAVGLFICLIPICSYAYIRLPALFSDGMVLQQKDHVAFWGWATAYEEITIGASWSPNEVKSTAYSTVRWFTHIHTPSAGGPYEINIFGLKDTITLKQVLIGEIWLCSGQSNMEFPLGLQGGWKTGVFNYEKEVEAASYPNIRMFQVKRNTSATLETDIEGKWEYCEPEFAANFTAVAYYFARELAEKMK